MLTLTLDDVIKLCNMPIAKVRTLDQPFNRKCKQSGPSEKKKPTRPDKVLINPPIEVKTPTKRRVIPPLKSEDLTDLTYSLSKLSTKDDLNGGCRVKDKDKDKEKPRQIKDIRGQGSGYDHGRMKEWLNTLTLSSQHKNNP